MDSFFGELIKLGAAGLVIYIIARPLIVYLIDRSKMQDIRMEKLIDEHLVKDAERHSMTVASLEHVERSLGSLESVLKAMPEQMMSEAKKIYPVMAQPSTTVNVASPK